VKWLTQIAKIAGVIATALAAVAAALAAGKGD
jgi:hypothetical protein